MANALIERPTKTAPVPAVVNVTGVLVLTHLLFRSFKHFTAIGMQERHAGLNFSPGVLMATVVVIVMVLTQRSWKAYGLWPLSLPGCRHHPAKVILWAVLLYAPPAWMMHYHGGYSWPVFIGFLTTTAFGEEIFFRGYVQPRLNEAFGRQESVRGVRFGAGLLITAILFAFLHALNRVDYFEARYTFDWIWAVRAFFAALLFGLIREATGNILAGSILHGLLDVWIYGLLTFLN